MVLTGDFLIYIPGRMVLDICSMAAPMYGCEVNNLLVDILNDCTCGLEQLVNPPKRNNNTLDLVLSMQPNILSETQVVPGISDHGAVFFQLYQTHSS